MSSQNDSLKKTEGQLGGSEPTISQKAVETTSEIPANDSVEVSESFVDAIRKSGPENDQTVDFLPDSDSDSSDPNCPTIASQPQGSDQGDADSTGIFNPLLKEMENQDPNAATFDFTPSSTADGEATAVLPKGWVGPKTFSLAPSPVLDSRLHSRSGSANNQRIPKQIGSYTIEKVLGRGGMGIVYKAFQAKLGRPVALKMILGGAHVSEQVLHRFIAEAKAVAHLQHPNIVQIFEVGDQDGLPFFSLEYVNGPPLDKKLDGKPIAPEDAARWLIEICTAMQYAHDNGVLHRDLKPANVLSTKEGVLKVSDFGLAKRLEDDADSSSTREGTIMGTPNYMSPEQARGAIHELGPATDQYSLGAMLYEFLTGRPPFMAPKPLETIMQVINSEPIPPRQLQPKLPIDIETICLKALQKDPSKRYASCAELAADLKRFLSREPILARPVGTMEQAWRWYLRNRLVGNLAMATAMGLVSVAGVSTYAAYSLNSKNKALAISEKQTQDQADLAKRNEADAIANKELAEQRAEGVIKTAQQFFQEFKKIDPNLNPKIKEPRERVMRLLLPLLEDHVLNQNPSDDNGILTATALRYEYAIYMSQFGMKERASKALTELEPFFRNRAIEKKSDAARSNYVQMIRVIAVLERELSRNMKKSLVWYDKQVELAEQIVANPTADSNNKGMFPWHQASILYARALHDLAVTYWRIGQIPQVLEQIGKTQKVCRDAIKRLDQESTAEGITRENQAVLFDQKRAFAEVLSNSEILLATYQYRDGQIEIAEPKLQSAVEQSRLAYEKDVNSALLLRRYCEQLGLFSELMCQAAKTTQGLEGLEQSEALSKKLLSFAPDNSDFIRTNCLAGFRLTQWKRKLKLPDADPTGLAALAARRKKSAEEDSNDVAKLDWMMSEAQVGESSKAEELISSFLSREIIDNEMLLLIARSYCVLASRSSDPQESNRLQGIALETIKKAISQGFLEQGMLKTDVDLQCLRDSGKIEELLQAMTSSQP